MVVAVAAALTDESPTEVAVIVAVSVVAFAAPPGTSP